MEVNPKLLPGSQRMKEMTALLPLRSDPLWSQTFVVFWAAIRAPRNAASERRRVSSGVNDVGAFVGVAMPRLPMPPTNEASYQKNTKEQYEMLGRFVEAFELMVNEVREIASH